MEMSFTNFSYIFFDQPIMIMMQKLHIKNRGGPG